MTKTNKTCFKTYGTGLLIEGSGVGAKSYDSKVGANVANSKCKFPIIWKILPFIFAPM